MHRVPCLIRPAVAARATALVACLLAAAPLCGLDRWILQAGGRETTLPVEISEEGPLFSLEPIAGALGLEMEKLDRRSAVLKTAGGRRLLCQARHSVVIVGEEVILLGRPLGLRRGSLLVPEEFIERALATLLGRPLRPESGEGVLRLGDAGLLHALWRTVEGRSELFVETGTVAGADRFQPSLDGDTLALRIPASVQPPEGPSPATGILDLQQVEGGGSLLRLRPAPGYTVLPVQEDGGLRLALVEREDILGPPSVPAREQAPAAGTLAADPDAALFDLVVLDPGHGGGEMGAVGPTGLREKDISLRIALLLAERLKKHGIEVALTRETDQEVLLDDRTAFANQLRADLFVSLHANASTVPMAVGSETFFLSREATDEMSRKVAAIESNAIGVRGRGLEAAPGALEMTLWEMAQAQFLQESERLAGRVQAELNRLAGTPDRGVKQGPLTVLMGATMPAVLVEVGFITNPVEERKLRDPAHLKMVAEAISRAILSFGEERRRRAASRSRP